MHETTAVISGTYDKQNAMYIHHAQTKLGLIWDKLGTHTRTAKDETCPRFSKYSHMRAPLAEEGAREKQLKHESRTFASTM